MKLVPPKELGSIVHLGTHWHYSLNALTRLHESIGTWHENTGMKVPPFDSIL
jgi:hypothetical protein